MFNTDFLTIGQFAMDKIFSFCPFWPEKPCKSSNFSWDTSWHSTGSRDWSHPSHEFEHRWCSQIRTNRSSDVKRAVNILEPSDLFEKKTHHIYAWWFLCKMIYPIRLIIPVIINHSIFSHMSYTGWSIGMISNPINMGKYNWCSKPPTRFSHITYNIVTLISYDTPNPHTILDDA